MDTQDTRTNLVSVGVGCSWVAVAGDTAVCNQWRGSVECKGWAPDYSGLYTDYWNQSGEPQSGWEGGEESKQTGRMMSHS